MTVDEKLATIKTILGSDAPDDETISSYLELAKNEILQWRYSYSDADMPVEVPQAYEMTQIYAVVNGFTQRGVEGQSVSIENGIHRHFAFTDMVNYIRGNVVAMAKVPGRVVSE